METNNTIYQLNTNRKRLLESIIYFSVNLKYPTKMMIYKVLTELDFRHFKMTGLPVTNLQYKAWKWGPVPFEFDKEISDRKDDCVKIPRDFSDSLTCEKEEWETDSGEKRRAFKFKATRKVNLEIFTPRQIKILEEVLFIYKKESATTASKASHEKNTPWEITVKKKGKEGELIDYFDFIDQGKISKDEVLGMLKDISTFQFNYQKKQ